ncbi:MAG: VWA domain-containing protein [Peptococcaceae bacterium]|nr:VWA domain-containing protein [Peptococcaceae bacterium]
MINTSQSPPLSIAQLFGLTENPDTVDKSNQVVRQDVYDGDLYTDTIKDSPALQAMIDKGREFLPVFDWLAQDLFISLFKVEPEILPDDEINERAIINKRIVERLFESKDFQRLRGMTQLDPITSALGTQVLAEKTIRQLESNRQENGRDSTGNDTKGQPAGNQQMERDTVPDCINGTEHTGVKVTFSTFDINGEDEHNIIDAVTTASREAADEIKELMEQVQQWGLEPGNPSLRISFENKRRALEKLRSSPNLKELAGLVGRFRSLARQVFRKKREDGAITVNSVTTGGNLEQVLPTEKMMLARPATRLDFIRRYTQKELLQYQSKNQPAGKGPLVVCCDVSGSMAGKPEQWSKATVLALAEVAQRQKRDFAAIYFNTVVQETWVIPRSTWNPAAIIEMAEVAPSGGTNFEAPLARALDIINESRFCKADVIFITDGHCVVNEEFLKTFNKTKQQKGFAVFTVLINIGNKASTIMVEQFSDEVVTVSSLAQLDEDSSSQLFRSINDRGRPS